MQHIIAAVSVTLASILAYLLGKAEGKVDRMERQVKAVERKKEIQSEADRLDASTLRNRLRKLFLLLILANLMCGCTAPQGDFCILYTPVHLDLPALGAMTDAELRALYTNEALYADLCQGGLHH